MNSSFSNVAGGCKNERLPECWDLLALGQSLVDTSLAHCLLPRKSILKIHKQGQIQDHYVVACGWAGAEMPRIHHLGPFAPSRNRIAMDLWTFGQPMDGSKDGPMDTPLIEPLDKLLRIL